MDTGRRARRVLAGVALLAVVVAGLGLVTSRHEGGRTPRASAPPTSGVAAATRPLGATISIVVVEPTGDLVVHQLADGSTHRLASEVGGWPLGPRSVGGHLLYISGGRIFDTGGGVVTSGTMLVPVAGAAEFWTTPEVGTNTEAVRWSIGDPGRGVQLVETASLAYDELPVAAAPGVLVTVSSHGAAVRGPGTALTGVTHRDQILGVTSDRLAYVGDCQPVPRCLHIVDLRTGNDLVTVDAVPGGVALGGAMAPDGSGRIATFRTDPSPGNGEGPALYPLLVDATGEADVIGPKLEVGEPVGAAAWDPTGRWLVYGGLQRTYLYDTMTRRGQLLPFYAGYGFVVTSPEFAPTRYGATVGDHAP